MQSFQKSAIIETQYRLYDEPIDRTCQLDPSANVNKL